MPSITRRRDGRGRAAATNDATDNAMDDATGRGVDDARRRRRQRFRHQEADADAVRSGAIAVSFAVVSRKRWPR